MTDTIIKNGKIVTGTQIIDGIISINDPGMDCAKHFDAKIAKVAPQAYVDYCFWGGLVSKNFQD